MVAKCCHLHLLPSAALHIGQSTWMRIMLLMMVLMLGMTMLLMMTIVGALYRPDAYDDESRDGDIDNVELDNTLTIL